MRDSQSGEGRMKSFTERVREELAENLPSPQCCRRSMLCGILINADCSPDGGIYAKLSGREAAELVLKLLREIYGREASAEYSNSYGRVSAEIVFSSEKLADKLREFSLEKDITLFYPVAFLLFYFCDYTTFNRLPLLGHNNYYRH